MRRVAERNALRCSLLRSEARKKQQPKVSKSKKKIAVYFEQKQMLDEGKK